MSAAPDAIVPSASRFIGVSMEIAASCIVATGRDDAV
jgi:hypothetical protein